MTLPALKDLFARNRAKATGLWRLGLEPNRTIYIEAGDVVFASSTFPQDRLTHLLVERSKITQAQLDYAMANLNPGMSIGKNLIEMGFITQRDLLEVARAQVERVVAASLATPNDIPSFEARELDATTVRLPFDTPGMLLSGVLSLEDREAVLEELGPLNQVVVLEGRRHQELTLVAGWLGFKGWKAYRAKHPAAPKVQPKAPVPSPKAPLPTPAKPTPEPPKPTQAEPVAASPAPSPSTTPAPTKPEPAKPEPVKPQPVVPKEEPVAPKADRLQAILHGDWKKALAQGAAQRKALQGKWTLRLEIACQGTTVQHAADILKDRDPDLFLVAMAMRDGRSCYQVFVGSFGSEAAAKEAAKKLPAPFLAEGNRPKPFRVAQIPDRQ